MIGRRLDAGISPAILYGEAETLTRQNALLAQLLEGARDPIIDRSLGPGRFAKLLLVKETLRVRPQTRSQLRTKVREPLEPVACPLIKR